MRTSGADAKQHQNVDNLTLDEMLEAKRGSMLEQTRGGNDAHFNHEAPWNQISSTTHPLEGVLRGHRLPFVQVVHIPLFEAFVAIGGLQSTAVAVRFLHVPEQHLHTPARCVERPPNWFAWKPIMND